jgi:hypothetical protein
MSDIRKLLEAMDSMAAAEKKSTGPAWPGYWKGTDTAKKSRSRMVGDGGAAESVEEDLEESLRRQFAEYGAPGTAVGPGNDDLDPVELAAQRNQVKYGKDEIKGQIAGLTAQLQGARSQFADMNQQFPQGANPVEKTMALQQMNAQKIGIKQQIEDLTRQIAALRPQAI